MILPLAIVLAFSSQPASGDAWQIVRAAQIAVEMATDRRFEHEWRASAARSPADYRALLALATLERLRYRYESADSLYERILKLDSLPSQYAASAHFGMAAWRALGVEIARADSLFARARAEAAAAGDGRTESQALVGLSQIRGRRAGPAVGLQLVREARAALTRPTPDEAAQSLCLEGSFMEQLGDSTGRKLVFRGRDLARAAGARRALAGCDVFLAQTAERIGEFDFAARTAAEAVELFEAVHYLPGVANASEWLGYVRSQRGFFADAEHDLRLAIRAAQVTRFGNLEAWARASLADIYLALGEASAAHEQAVRAAELHTAYGDLWGLAIDRRFEGLVLQSQGHLDEACAKLADAVAAYRRAGLAFNAVEPLRLLAVANMSAGRLDAAEKALDDATKLARASGNAGWAEELPVHLAKLAMLRGDLHGADSLVAIARPRYAWRSVDSTELLNVSFAVLEAQLALRMHRVATADSAIAFISSAIARHRRDLSNGDLRAGLAQLRGEWGGLSESYPEMVAGLVAGGRIESAFRFIEGIRAREIADAALRTIARIADSSAALAEFRRVSPSTQSLSLQEVRQHMLRDEALVVLTLGVAGAPTTAIVVTSDTASAVSLPARSVLGPLIDHYLRVASTGIEPVALGRQLGAALIQPIVALLPARVTRLAISPDGDLFRIPFDALRLADGRYVVERLTVSLVPSATVAGMLHAMHTARGATRIIAVGDPTFRREPPIHGDDTARFAGTRLVRLPQSAEEARRVAEYGARSIVLTGSGATKMAIREADWSTIGVVHFATHALIGESQSRTALAFSPSGSDDGFLTTSEIATLHFGGSLVVLSACQSLGGQILAGEGLRGLTGPLFEAGARAIVVTHWSIGDRSVLPFIDRFYAAMASGESVGDALRQTKLAAIRDGARISDWAAFTVIGDASMHPPLKPRKLTPLNWLHDLVQPTRDTSRSGTTGAR